MKDLLLNTGSKEQNAIAAKVLDGERITKEDGIFLYEHADTAWLGMLASQVRERKNQKLVFYNRNFHIEPTNICIYNCTFCSYNDKNSDTVWDHSLEEIIEKVKELDSKITELHIVGGVHPDRGTEHYSKMLKMVKEVRPDLHLKAFSAIEISFMAKKDRISYQECLLRLKESGLDSIPGGGAEIFDSAIRKQVCGEKDTAEQWLEIHQTAHENGIPTNATMLYGHLESYAHRVDHLDRLRQLQDTTSGFNTFIPLKFKRENNALSHLTESTTLEDLRNYAVSRIFLDNFDHIKAYWPMIGKSIAQLSLSYGVDDLDGTINDSTKIYSLAGAEDKNPSLGVESLRQLITDAGFVPQERDSVYNSI